MGNDSGKTPAGQAYAIAYAEHYKESDLHRALELYSELITSFPDAPEAGYSRAQVQNIVKAVVPEEELFDALLQVAHAHLGREGAQ